MSRVTCSVAISLDGFMAGNNMSLDEPFGDASPQLFHGWRFSEPEKHASEIKSFTDAGAYIMGRNMFGPKDLQSDTSWNGWWGNNPPYHASVFVLSHSQHKPIYMQGGTSFTFVTDGIESALKKAQAAAGAKDVVISGGANVINQYLIAGHIDELWLHIVPVTIGSGQRLFNNTPGITLKPLEARTTDHVTHIKYAVLHN